MALMEFLKANKLDTTTSIKVQAGNTGTVAYSFDRNRSLGFTSVGYSSNTSCVFSVEFPTPTVLSHVLIQNHNLKGFRLFYNSVTANSLAIVSQNSATNYYLGFASVTVSSITLQMDTPQTADTEKTFGELVLTERRLQFERNPESSGYNPTTKRKRIRHEMPDGGVKIMNIRDKFYSKMKWKYLSDSFTSSLGGVWDDGLPVYFVPFPTTTAWDGKAHEVLWTNDFDFSYDSNNKTSGQGGEMVLEETTSA